MKGAEVNSTNKKSLTPLHHCQSILVAKTLISHGAQVNVQDDLQQTILHKTVRPEMVQLLVANGADVELRDHSGRTPYQSAVKRRVEEVAAALKIVSPSSATTPYESTKRVYNPLSDQL